MSGARANEKENCENTPKILSPRGLASSYDIHPLDRRTLCCDPTTSSTRLPNMKILDILINLTAFVLLSCVLLTSDATGSSSGMDRGKYVELFA